MNTERTSKKILKYKNCIISLIFSTHIKGHCPLEKSCKVSTAKCAGTKEVQIKHFRKWIRAKKNQIFTDWPGTEPKSKLI